MNGTRAKQLRNKAFEVSAHAPSRYSVIEHVRLYFVKRGEKSRPKKDYRHTVRWEGYKRTYKDFKKAYKLERASPFKA